jgi:hypothetical protein
MYRDESVAELEKLTCVGLCWFWLGLLDGALSEQPVEHTQLSRSMLA